MIRPVRDEQSYGQSLARIEELWGTKQGTADGDELDVLMILVEVYEEKNYPMPPSDPVQAILFRMEQMELRRKDLEPFLGPKSRVSDVLNRKRSLSMKQVINLHHGMNIPYESLLAQNSMS